MLIKSNIGTEFNNRAHTELIMKAGKELQLANKQYDKFAKVKFLKSKCHIVEYMVENKHDRKI